MIALWAGLPPTVIPVVPNSDAAAGSLRHLAGDQLWRASSARAPTTKFTVSPIVLFTSLKICRQKPNRMIVYGYTLSLPVYVIAAKCMEGTARCCCYDELYLRQFSSSGKQPEGSGRIQFRIQVEACVITQCLC